MLSIAVKKEGNVYSVHKKSSKEVVYPFAIITKRKSSGVSIERNPIAPDGNARLCADIIKKLVDHYPGYVWMVEVDDRPTVGMVNIYNQDVNVELFSNASYGYQFFLSRVQNDPNLKCVIMAGGEILERARLARSANKGEEIKIVDGVADHHQPLIY